jgi:hypothetical protein
MLSVVLSAMLSTGKFIPTIVEPPKPPTPVGTGTRYAPKVDRSAPRKTEGAGSR